MTSHFEVYGFEHADTTHEGEFGWRLRAANGEIVAHGEGFTRRRDVHRAIAAVVRAVRETPEGSTESV